MTLVMWRPLLQQQPLPAGWWSLGAIWIDRHRRLGWTHVQWGATAAGCSNYTAMVWGGGVSAMLAVADPIHDTATQESA